jgi:tetratricopeptide (TPR) repeat protein
MTVDKWVEIAKERGRNEDYDGAIDACEEALTIAPEDVDAMDVMARIYVNSGAFDKAKAVLKKVIKARPNDPLYRLMLAGAHGSLGERSRAREAADAAIDLDSGELGTEITVAHLLKASMFSAEGELKEAIESMQAAIESNPGDPQNAGLYGMMGFLHLLDHEVEKALEASDKALAIDPDCEQARNVRSQALFGEGEIHEAFAEFGRLPGRAKTPQILENKGTFFSMLGKHRESLAAFSEALALDSNSENAIVGKAIALNALKKPQKALETIRAVEPRRRLELPNALVTEGNALKDLRRLNRALECFDQAVNLDQDRIDGAHYGRFSVLYQMTEYEKAIGAIQAALSIRPHDAMYLMSAAILHAQHVGTSAEGWEKLIRVVYLAERGDGYWIRRKAREELPRALHVLRRFYEAPLLVVRIIRSYGMANTILGNLSFVSKAFRNARSYDVLQVIAARSGVSEMKAHMLLGLKAHRLGDPFTAERHFDRADEIDDSDLQGVFYLIRMYLEFQKKLTAEVTLDSVRDTARAVLRSVGHHEEVPARQLYYAGHLFVMGDRPQPLLALRCFESAAERGMLPAMYMVAQLQHATKGGASDAFQRAVRMVLDEERNRMREGSPQRRGFLSGPANHSNSSSWTDGGTGRGTRANRAANSVEAALRAEERALQHWAHVSELSDSFPLIYDWLSKQENDEGGLPKQYRFVDLPARFDHDRAIRSWDREESARERFEEQLARERPAIDVRGLRDTLANRFPVPPGWIRSEEVDSEQLEKWVAQSIREDTRGSNTQMHRLSILYLAICGRITPRATIDLTAYLGCFVSPKIVRARKKAIEGGVGGAMVDLSQVAMQMAGVVFGPIVSIASSATVYVVGALIAEQVQAMSEKSRPSYEEFKADFHDRVDGKGEDVCNQLEELLKEIRAQKS